MRVAWNCNPLPGCIVFVAAEDGDMADAIAVRRMGFGTTIGPMRDAVRWPELDGAARECPEDSVLSIEEH